MKPNSPEKLLELMAVTQSEYSVAITALRGLERLKMAAETRTTVILTAKRFDLLQNVSLRDHFQKCCEADPKFKPTVDFIASCVYLEHEELMENYNAQEKASKQAEKEFAMLSSQLIWYQSKNKVKGIEMINKL